MSSTDPPVGLPQGVRLQRLAPRSSRLRNAHPEWEVWVEKERIGLIQQWRVASASSTFFRATAFHPDTGAPIPLESSTDLGERVEKVIAARHEPDRFIHKASWE